uniref:leucine--tRNA ligase n=1 Tax=viral metagenome TaxID=1070528 RepID=A0A6C0JVZ3_9ZZZZ
MANRSKVEKLIQIEKEIQYKWELNKIFNKEQTIDERPKFLATFPYPYMNGKLHLGHAFTISKAEFAVGFSNLDEKNTLFPFSFHCSGIPIKISADKIKSLDKEQYDIMKSMGIPDNEIPLFSDPTHWLEYFPNQCKSDLISMGVKIDWRRSFITTDKNPYYDSFIRWQFLNLLKEDKIKFGKRYSIYSPNNKQICMDHDRSEGEGVGIQEYILLKFKFVNKIFQTPSNIFLVTQTSCPESIYDLKRLLIYPESFYFVYELSNEDHDIFISNSKIYMNLLHQLPYNLKLITKLSSSELNGKKVSIPLTSIHIEVQEDKEQYVNLLIDITIANDRTDVKRELIESGNAIIYYEPEKTVISRSGDNCVVALLDQWYIKYGEEEWKNKTKNVLDQIKTFSIETKNHLNISLDWIHEHACSRSYGLGTKLPWDTQYFIDSLSDSTIYMAYYTISHLLQGNINGSTSGTLDIESYDMTPDVWEYIFKDLNYSYIDTKISKDKLDTLKKEFRYWYPIDLRVSGKDLIPNHLIYMLYNHIAIWPKESNMWPKAIRANGHLNLNNMKMSKSTGNFLTLSNAIKKYSADGVRLALANASDNIDDANFDENMTEAGILKLFNFLEWCKDVLDEIQSYREGIPTFHDKVFKNEMLVLREDSYKSYSEMKYKEALNSCFYKYQSSRDKYREFCGNDKMHKELVLEFIETQLIILSPICPHITEYIWEIMNKKIFNSTKTYILYELWPKREEVNDIIFQMSHYVDKCIKEFRIKRTKNEKKHSATIHIAKEYSQWQKEIIKQLEEPNTIDTYLTLIKTRSKKEAKRIFAFASSYKNVLPFDEIEVLQQNSKYILETLKLKDLEIIYSNDEKCVPGSPFIIYN